MFVLIAVEFATWAGIAVGMLDALVLGVTAVIEIALSYVTPGLAQVVIDFQTGAVGMLRDVGGTLGELPTLFGRELIPNQGHQTPDGSWQGTFLGLQPAVAWAIRFSLIIAYALFTAYWVFRGWLVYREHYREADWTPTDDIVDNLRGHRWGQFGLIVLIVFLTMATFGSALAPSTVDQNIQSPYAEENQIQYLSEEGTVETVFAGDANFNSKSKGAVETNVGVMSYDDYSRFHPFGTLPNGRDLFTFMMGGARITMIVSGMAITGAAGVAMTLSMLSAYYRGSLDLGVLTVSDGVVSIPQLLLLIMVSAVFADTWLGGVLDGGFLLALIFAFTTWPFLWRAVRGPALQVAQEEWVRAAESYGQQPRKIMRKHMLPYILGYLLVYASMSVGGIIISLSALSFLGNGLGIDPPTPAWGRAISAGQSYVSSVSWHISLIPGLMIVLLVTGMNALGDGIRDAIDPETESGEGEEAAAGGGA
ncbi:ABC transporter permease [Halorubrum lacusprofundi]|uniref:Binding-protein-dependent transport systems inner membrane component n=2 Tax=Halorubrum lacusprofundi TaxID=2247 RepID=B9LQS1_HALLT|nr:ABC transporter permease [Halorubrum lacusprofundi]ACM55673.1 binding-protein-dependent transport systems inner membrane component [Halorubrum lacusprofundi ATCC 49239]MCG1007141.1 ABC transporter permease [Halorubrum lacusprofundi]